ncbi:GNAT family N-acetyltransferase [Mycolicibacterium mageritense]|uniref:GNAT family N-acetyltransferase n=1 Tax=Mycolicibacterium mageritense TaxID=53462 RepID=UPI0011D999F7|nr:GNAT family N-acetyltransferase [Mycolicibacterium mageritense]TXI60926.1 MAG: GNAT family N-acetyltransferase [Mycolicibacterium mageritense]
MAQIREIMNGETALAAEAMLLLRPRWLDATTVVEFIDTQLRPTGYRLVGVFESGASTALSVLGFREMWSTAFGHYLYVDDVSTLEAARGKGFADELIRWVVAEAHHRECAEVHLDSGVGNDRAPAHRLYIRNHFRISAHHFSLEVDS